MSAPIHLCIKRLIFTVLVLAITSGCASTSFRAVHPGYVEADRIIAIYVYSFVDLKEDLLGKVFMAEMEGRLQSALEKEGLKVKQLWFNKSPLRAQFALETKGGGRAVTRVPVDEVIQATNEDERGLQATHRLIIFPESLFISSGIHYNFRWDLINIKSNKLSWRTVSNSQHILLSSRDGQASERAAAIVEGFVSELRKSGALNQEKSTK